MTTTKEQTMGYNAVEREKEIAALKAMIRQLGENAAKAAYEYAENMAGLRATIAQQGEELARMREELRKANEPQWFYNPDDCEVCHYSPYEVIDYIDPDRSGVFEVSTGRPCASIWCAVRVNDDEDADERYTFTEHATEEVARTALESPKQ